MRVSFILVLLCVSSSALAGPYECISFDTVGIERPKAPSCVDDTLKFSEMDFQMCRSDMESYTQKMKDYQLCLQAEAEDALKEEKKAIEKFNCKASGQDFC